MNIEPSVSSRVVNHLRNGMAVDTLFTCDDLRIECGLPPKDTGAVSGTLSRARKVGLIEFVHINATNEYTYRVADRNAVMKTKAVRGQGGKAGSMHKWRKEFTAPRVAKADPFDGVTPANIPHVNAAQLAQPGPPSIAADMAHIDAQQTKKVRGLYDTLLELTELLNKADAVLTEAFLVDAAPTLTTATKEQLLAELAKRMT